MKLYSLFLFFSFYEVTDSVRLDLHKILSLEELRRYLATDSQAEVPDYDVAQVVHRRNKRSSHSSQKRFMLSAFGKDMELVLERNDDVIGDGGLPVERRTVDGSLSKEVHFPKEDLYVGHVASESESHVAVRETEKKGQLRGAIMTDGHFYQLKPLTDDLHQRAALNGTGYHVVSRRSVESILAGANKTIPITVQDQGDQQDEAVTSQDVVFSGPVFIEAQLTADRTTCDYYGNETLDYLLDVANLISRLYKHKSIGMDVTWVLVKVFLVEGFDPQLDIQTNDIKAAGQYLWKYRKWSAVRNPPDGVKEHYDQSALLTRRICGLGSCYIDGLAYYNTPCSKYWGASINEARGLTAAFTVAHEMGHNIGLPHDQGDCAQGYIMATMQSAGPNAFRWSTCSRDRLQEIFRRNTCFHNKPPQQLSSPMLPPGYIHDRDKQCQMAYGPEFRVCPSLVGSCGALYCTQTGGSCYTRGAPIAEGSPCGYRKWCRAGDCSDVGSSLPPPVDGGWSSWGPYGACTRTCGGGVKYRSRKCDNPMSQYFGKDCEGSSKGYFAMCNTQDCDADTFRQEQCEEHNHGSTKYHAYFLGGAQKCRLACVTGRKGHFFGNVKDSTRCEENQHVYDVCIEGKCHKVGCDKKLSSTLVYDRCLHCGGNGSSCVLTQGIYTKDYRVYGPYNGDTMFTIPKRATNVRIYEMEKSINFLTITTQTGTYYIPVPSYTRTYHAAGTSIYHYMREYVDAEEIFIRGPTNEALQAKFVYSGRDRNPGIFYSFYAPGNATSANFVWKRGNEGGCSASCAGGVQMIKVTCHREDDDSEVAPDYCDINAKPAESEPCNQAACPKQFELGVWSPCSQKCGGGQQYRNLTCVQVVSKKVINVLAESECAQLPKPENKQECNGIDCLPEWVVGNWTQCSVPCGGGTKSRQVECKKKLGSGVWVTLPAHICDDITRENPQNVTQCNTMPCFKWKVQYPCVTCGGSDRTYAPVGCFHDKRSASRPLPELIGNHRKTINWKNMSLTVQKCAQDAWKKQFAVFGVQFYGECWSGILGYKTYDEDGSNSEGCWEGVGRSWNNYVYAFRSLVVEPLVDCIYAVTNQAVSEDHCSSARPYATMKLCSHVCSIAVPIAG